MDYIKRMNAFVFGTHGFIKSLTDAGMPEQQAEILAAISLKITLQPSGISKNLRQPKA